MGNAPARPTYSVVLRDFVLDPAAEDSTLDGGNLHKNIAPFMPPSTIVSDPRRATPQPEAVAGLPPWREPVRGGYFEPHQFALSCVATPFATAELSLRRTSSPDIRSQTFRPRTVPCAGRLYGSVARPASLTGLTVHSASTQAVEYTLPTSEWLCAPLRGRVQGGATALLAESALNSAIHVRLPASLGALED